MKFRKITNLIFKGRTRDFQIIQFTSNISKNPYYTMVGDELISRGIDYKYIPNFQKIKEILDKKPSLVHFHQLSPFYYSKNKEETLKKAYNLLERLNDIKNQGGKIIYTMHNPYPHNRTFKDIDEMINQEMNSISDNIIVLGQSAKEILIKDQNVKIPISVVMHPSFKEFYGTKPNKNQARIEFGLPTDAIIFGNIGHIKPYKGLEFIIEAFIEFSKKQNSQRNLHLCIAGTSTENRYISSLKKNYSNKNISIINRDLKDLEMIKLVSALDYSVFAFTDIWASSSVVLSLSYGIPVIVPNIGCMGDYVENSYNGFLYIPNNIQSLINTFNLILNYKNYNHLEYMCNKYSKEFTVSKSADKFLNIYKQVLINI